MAAIDGLGSGLDTTSIIKQLMDLERLPQTRLSTQKTAATTRSATWSQLDLALGALKTAAVKLAVPGAISGAATSTSSDTSAVGVTANIGALPGTYKVEVSQLATAFRLTSNALPTEVGAGSFVLHSGLSAIGITTVEDAAPAVPEPPLGQTYTVKVSADGTQVTVTSGSVVETGAPGPDGTVTLAGLKLTASTLQKDTVAEVTVARTRVGTSTLTDLAKAVNAAGGSATATVVNDGTGKGTLVLSAKTTGSAAGFEVGYDQLPALKAASPTFTPTAGLDAIVEINDIPVTSRSNTLTGTIPGVTLTLQKPVVADPVVVTVAQDTVGPAAQVKGVVEAMNALFTQVTGATKYDVAAKKGAPLSGNAAVRQITNDLYNVVGSVTPPGSGQALNRLGIFVQADGKYAFNELKLTASLTANPTATADLVVKLTTALSGYVDDLRNGKVVNGQQMPGIITAGKDSAQSEAERLQKRIEEWDRRLALTQSRLTKQYTALDSALGGLKSQGTWLSGAIGSLGKWE
jgi:flagellar hook-associated protein 2